jgi:hypothetical protein
MRIFVGGGSFMSLLYQAAYFPAGGVSLRIFPRPTGYHHGDTEDTEKKKKAATD